jgi:hypothetical protein
VNVRGGGGSGGGGSSGGGGEQSGEDGTVVSCGHTEHTRRVGSGLFVGRTGEGQRIVVKFGATRGVWRTFSFIMPLARMRLGGVADVWCGRQKHGQRPHAPLADARTHAGHCKHTLCHNSRGRREPHAAEGAKEVENSHTCWRVGAQEHAPTANDVRLHQAHGERSGRAPSPTQSTSAKKTPTRHMCTNHTHKRVSSAAPGGKSHRVTQQVRSLRSALAVRAMRQLHALIQQPH